MDPAMVPLNLSLDVDLRLWPQDIRGSRAWAGALGRAGVLELDEVQVLQDGLDAVASRLATGLAGPVPDEDIHSLVERLLREEVGAVAGKLHTGRSRNDQVATDVRLWGMEALEAVAAQLEGLARALVELAERSVDLIIPGYTHLQQGQPVRAAHWALSHLWPLLRDRDRMVGAGEGAAVLPLGSGALAGCPFPVDREFLRETLGFARVSENSMDAVSDRDWMAEALFAGSLVGIHLSRLGEDLVLFASREFGLVRVPDGFSTGSSLMPQKRNPDVGELIRGKSGRFTGNLVSLLTLLKGLPTGYNRDLQEDKRLLFDTFDQLALVLPAVTGTVEGLQWRPDRAGELLSEELLATDLADYLVRRGVPFRESHEAIGRLVALSERESVPLSRLSLDRYREIHPSFDADLREVFRWESSVESRATPGGTSRASVEVQIAEARRRLGAIST
ncbi:MAG: argininosuccinate lyase [Gemmatimonadales bacterium]|nr:MAG: argininosuccinate lyase [Gemmatimonadales bacterium]